MNKKTTALPRRALLVSAPHLRAGSFSDSVTVQACVVLRIDGDDALVEVRTGATADKRLVSVADLASTAEKASAKLAAHFVALLSRPIQSAASGMTESTATANPSPVAA